MAAESSVDKVWLTAPPGAGRAPGHAAQMPGARLAARVVAHLRLARSRRRGGGRELCRAECGVLSVCLAVPPGTGRAPAARVVGHCQLARPRRRGDRCALGCAGCGALPVRLAIPPRRRVCLAVRAVAHSRFAWPGRPGTGRASGRACVLLAAAARLEQPCARSGGVRCGGRWLGGRPSGLRCPFGALGQVAQLGQVAADEAGSAGFVQDGAGQAVGPPAPVSSAGLFGVHGVFNLLRSG